MRESYNERDNFMLMMLTDNYKIWAKSLQFIFLQRYECEVSGKNMREPETSFSSRKTINFTIDTALTCF